MRRFTATAGRLAATISGFFLLTVPGAYAQIFNGGGVAAGIGAASGVTGLASGNPRNVIVNVLAAILSFAALLALVMVIIAGFYLVLSMGNDEKKEKAKKIIYYTLIGLVVLLFSRIIVSLVTVWLPSQV